MATKLRSSDLFLALGWPSEGSLCWGTNKRTLGAWGQHVHARACTCMCPVECTWCDYAHLSLYVPILVFFHGIWAVAAACFHCALSSGCMEGLSVRHRGNILSSKRTPLTTAFAGTVQNRDLAPSSTVSVPAPPLTAPPRGVVEQQPATAPRLWGQVVQ